ncbi:MAG: acyl-CoA dehydrogenase, partial [Bdellovibrionales bacterium]|nr:acyl-CoA dehydrogenase [Bdellovibrionales bacterium]
MSRGIEFVQEPAALQNQFASDHWLQHFLEWRLPKAQFEKAKIELERFAVRVGPEMMDLAQQAEAQEPRLVQFDAWGRRIDKIEMSPAWDKLAAIAAEEGIVAEGYERSLGGFSRLYQLAKLYLYHPSSAVFSCPLAMT